MGHNAQQLSNWLHANLSFTPSLALYDGCSFITVLILEQSNIDATVCTQGRSLTANALFCVEGSTEVLKSFPFNRLQQIQRPNCGLGWTGVLLMRLAPGKNVDPRFIKA